MQIMTFNNVRNPSNIYLLEGRQKAPFAPLNRTIQNKRLRKTDHDLLIITQPIGYVFKDDSQSLAIKDSLAEWLVTKDIAPLTFSDEPGRTYWCIVEGSIDDLSRFAYTRRGTIRFLCFYTTGESKNITVTPTPQQHEITGQTETPWEIEVNFTEPASRFELWAGDIYFQLNYDFIAGDKLTVSYEGRQVWLRDMDLRKVVSMSSHFEELKPGTVNVRATHECVLKYDEMYY